MLKFWIILTIILITVYSSSAQLFDDFGDGDFRTNPEWQGDLADFIVNDQYQLQLDAGQSGSSRIYTQYNSFDSLEWNLYLKMDFSPSNSNKLRVYFMLDSIRIDMATGYYIEIGENGSGDKLKLFGLENGEKTLLAEGEEGEFTDAPVETNIRIQRFYDGVISIDVKNSFGYFKNEFEIYSSIFVKDSAFFMLECDYTSTRKDKFYFDDISIKEYEKDVNPPEILYSEVLTKKSISIKFDEPLSKENIYNLENYVVTNNLRNPIKVEYEDTIPNNIKLEFDFDFESGIIYVLELKGIKDLNNNLITQSQFTNFYITDAPAKGDLVINEILFNPFSGGSDFLELVNISSKFLDLKGMIFKNNLKENSEIELEQNIILNPGNYICITKDTSDLLRDYFVPDTAFIIQNDLPSFDDDTGNITLEFYDINTGFFDTIDLFDYSKNMHSDFINDPEGISLERKNPLGKTNDIFNWGSASTLQGGATPGYKNSGYYDYNTAIDDKFLISNNIFSPDNDGIDDNLIIEYSFENSNNLTSIYIFDSKGRYVTKLLNNELLGTNGIISWNGFVDMKKMPVGVYVLFIETMDIAGNKNNYKKNCILAKNLN